MSELRPTSSLCEQRVKASPSPLRYGPSVVNCETLTPARSLSTRSCYRRPERDLFNISSLFPKAGTTSTVVESSTSSSANILRALLDEASKFSILLMFMEAVVKACCASVALLPILRITLIIVSRSDGEQVSIWKRISTALLIVPQTRTYRRRSSRRLFVRREIDTASSRNFFCTYTARPPLACCAVLFTPSVTALMLARLRLRPTSM